MSIFTKDSSLRNNEPNYQLVVEDRKTKASLFKRYDNDKKLAVLDPFKMTQLDGQPTPDVINVTMNEAMVYWNRCAAIMNGANMQRIVFGKDLTDKETTNIEKFYDDIYYTNDLMLANAIFISLYGFLIEQILIRGSIAARVLMRMDGDKFIPDIMPLDVRYFYYETDTTGLIWGAYDTTRTKMQIYRDYGIQIRSPYAVITDFWNDKVNDIFIAGIPYKGGSQANQLDGDHPERPREHGLDYPPLVYAKSGAGLQSFADAGIIKYQGESVFAPNRGLIPELHRAASIFMTLTDLSFEGALIANLEEPNEGSPMDSPYGRRKMTELGMNEKLSAVPVNDVRNAARLGLNMLVGALQRGGLPNIDYGNLSFPLSAVAISKLTASKDAIFIPRLNSLSLFFRAMSQMIKSQYVQAGYTVELGEEGNEKEYAASELDKKFGTKYEFHSTSPEQDIANYAIAQQAMAVGVSRETTFTKIIRFDDPNGEIMKSRAEKGEAGDIAQSLYLVGHQQIDDKKFIQAEMTLQQLEFTLRQRAMGMSTGLAPEKGGLPAGGAPKMLDLFDQGGGGRQAPGAEEDMEPDETDNRQQRRQEISAKSKETADARQ